MNTRTRTAQDKERDESEEAKKSRLLSRYKNINDDLSKMRDLVITPKDIPKKCVYLEDQLNSCNYLAEAAFELDSNKLVEHDAEFMLSASHFNQIVVKSLSIGTRAFHFKAFAQKLRNYLDIQSEGGLGAISSDDSNDESERPGPSRTQSTRSIFKCPKHDANLASFERLGRESAYLFYSSPPFKFINGSFDPGSVTIPAKKQRRTNRRLEESSAVLIKPNSSKGVAPTEDLKNGQEVERMFNKICDMASDSDTHTVPFSKAVIDPKSFGQTVENIFYSSFLVKEAVIRMQEQDDEVIIEPDDEEIETTQNDQQIQSKQCIFTVTMKDYFDWIENNSLNDNH